MCTISLISAQTPHGLQHGLHPLLPARAHSQDVYSVMANWGANHGVTIGGHVGADLITMCSMLRIPVTMHNVPEDKVYRPHVMVGIRHSGPVGCRLCRMQAIRSYVQIISIKKTSEFSEVFFYYTPLYAEKPPSTGRITPFTKLAGFV